MSIKPLTELLANSVSGKVGYCYIEVFISGKDDPFRSRIQAELCPELNSNIMSQPMGKKDKLRRSVSCSIGIITMDNTGYLVITVEVLDPTGFPTSPTRSHNNEF